MYLYTQHNTLINIKHFKVTGQEIVTSFPFLQLPHQEWLIEDLPRAIDMRGQEVFSHLLSSAPSPEDGVSL